MMVDEINWIPHSKRPEWKDVIPIYLTDEENSAVRIAYSEKFGETFAFVRAILQTDEKSPRAFDLTSEALQLNPANYTVWNFRRVLLKFLKFDLKNELDFISETIFENPKNYQVWHHRKFLIEETKNPTQELNFTAEILRDDAKNYHAWQHRNWVVQTFGLWNDELEFVGHLLIDDIRNNSAWNYRYFVINNTTGFTKEIAEREIGMTKAMIERCPNNESSWNYLQGILLAGDGVAADPELFAWASKLFEGGCRASYLLLFMVDFLNEKKENGANEKIRGLIDELINLDPVRENYYKFLQQK